MSRTSPIIVKQKGDFSKTERFMNKAHLKSIEKTLNRLGQRGVDALSAATPVDTGKTAASWKYEVYNNKESVTIKWFNENTTKTGENIVVLLVHGHGTRDGFYVRGNNFVTPAIRPIFDEIADEAWAEVKR